MSTDIRQGITEVHIFREVTEPLPPGWVLGHWQVEAHRVRYDGAYCCPVGIAWVNRIGINNDMPTIIEFVHVLPQFKRQGIARRLMWAVLDRWHDAICTNAIARESDELVAQFWAEVSQRWNCRACRGIWPKRVECKRCHGKPVPQSE